MHIEQVYKLWKMKIASISGIYKTRCHKDNCYKKQPSFEMIPFTLK